ncbi:unnamed protein product [Rhizophagus irregularis]|nr:unnamed protein product [Rhizophagus irregularis]
MNPTQKDHTTKQMLRQKVMKLCYQMPALRNKQVGGTKTAIGRLMVGSGTSKNVINTLANMGKSSTYQTVYNMFKKMRTIINQVFAHMLTVILIGCIVDIITFMSLFLNCHNSKLKKAVKVEL